MTTNPCPAWWFDQDADHPRGKVALREWEESHKPHLKPGDLTPVSGGHCNNPKTHPGTLAAFPMYGQECFVRIESFNVPIPPHTCPTQNPSDVQTKSCLNCELWILIQQHYWRAEPINWFYIDTLLWCSNLPQVLAPAFDINFKPV